jgi:hypothetical protein
MRPLSFGQRWRQPHPPARPWPQNPWINASSSAVQTGTAVDDAARKQEQTAAIGTWEDEGGSVGTDNGARRS